jgi:hypothetical protein
MGVKENGGEVNSTMIVRTFVKVTVYPQHNNNETGKKISRLSTKKSVPRIKKY